MSIFVNIFTLPEFTQTVDNLFNSFILLFENECLLISNLHWSFSNVTSCPFVTLCFLSEKNIFLSIFPYPLQFLETSIWSPINILVSRYVKPHDEHSHTIPKYLNYFTLWQSDHNDHSLSHLNITITPATTPRMKVAVAMPIHGPVSKPTVPAWSAAVASRKTVRIIMNS